MLVWKKEEVAPVCRVIIAGDFLPAGGLQLPKNLDWRDIAQGLCPRFAKADISITNLECCVDVGDSAPVQKLGPGDTFAAGPEVLDFFSHPGINVVGLANNHICDFGDEGMEATRRALTKRNLVSLGLGRTLLEPPDVRVIQMPTGLLIGIWAAARHLPELATHKKPGVEPATRRRAEEAIQLLKDQGVGLRIAYLHAGLERTNRPDPDDVELMDQFAHMGFDIVTACHSHRISGYRRVQRHFDNPAFCFYGLGGISSGVIYSELEREGIIVRVDIGQSGEIGGVEVHPIYLQESGWGCIPLLGDAHSILKRFEQVSQELENGTYRQIFYRDLKGNLSRSFFRNVQTALQKGGVRGLATTIGRVRMRHLNRLLHSGLS